MNSITAALPRRVPVLDGARSRGIYVEFYDPDGSRYGLPTYPYHWAPRHLATIRQLRARGLRPGGQQPAAQILWRKGRRVAYLYHIDAGAAQTAGHPRPARRPRRGDARPPHLPRLRPGKALLHPALTRRMQRLRGLVTAMTTPASRPRSGVNNSLTPRRRRRVVENDEYASFARRVIDAYSRRVAAGDIDAITGMTALADELDAAIRHAITGLRNRGYSWAEIGTRLGITRQAAQQRWGGDSP